MNIIRRGLGLKWERGGGGGGEVACSSSLFLSISEPGIA